MARKFSKVDYSFVSSLQLFSRMTEFVRRNPLGENSFGYFALAMLHFSKPSTSSMKW